MPVETRGFIKKKRQTKAAGRAETFTKRQRETPIKPQKEANKKAKRTKKKKDDATVETEADEQEMEMNVQEGDTNQAGVVDQDAETNEQEGSEQQCDASRAEVGVQQNADTTTEPSDYGYIVRTDGEITSDDDDTTQEIPESYGEAEVSDDDYHNRAGAVEQEVETNEQEGSEQESEVSLAEVSVQQNAETTTKPSDYGYIVPTDGEITSDDDDTTQEIPESYGEAEVSDDDYH